MELITIKFCVIFGLLLVTFVAACLPLLFLLPLVGYAHNYRISFSSHTGVSGYLIRLLPCLKAKSGRDGKLSTSSDFFEENEENKSGRGKKTTLFLDIMNCFSGGVFLGTSFLGLIPEIREIFDSMEITWPQIYRNANTTEDSLSKEDVPRMPITEILVTSGLFLILCTEQVVHSITERKGHKRPSKDSSAKLHVSSQGKRATEDSEKIVDNGQIDQHSALKVTACDTSGMVFENEVVFDDNLSVNGKIGNEKESIAEESHNHDEHMDDSPIRSLILLLTLSVHSLLEGLAIGLQKNVSSALSIFVAVLFHKSLMAFSMGNNLVQANQSARSIIVAAAVLAATSPSGIAIGMVMKDSYHGTEIVNGTLQAIATGTFLFITFFEVLAKEFQNHANRVFKTISFILGYCCILGIMFIHHGA